MEGIEKYCTKLHLSRTVVLYSFGGFYWESWECCFLSLKNEGLGQNPGEQSKQIISQVIITNHLLVLLIYSSSFCFSLPSLIWHVRSLKLTSLFWKFLCMCVGGWFGLSWGFLYFSWILQGKSLEVLEIVEGTLCGTLWMKVASKLLILSPWFHVFK